MFKKLLSKKVLKFLFGGDIAAIFNLLLIFLLIETLGWNTPLRRNIANTLAMELSFVSRLNL